MYLYAFMQSVYTRYATSMPRVCTGCNQADGMHMHMHMHMQLAVASRGKGHTCASVAVGPTDTRRSLLMPVPAARVHRILTLGMSTSILQSRVCEKSAGR